MNSEAPLSLETLQNWFLEVITEPRSLSEIEIEHERRLHGLRVNEIVSHSPLEVPSERIEVYRHAYFARLIECLEGDYPATKALLGEESFVSIATKYVVERPSKSPNLNNYGEHFATHLRTEGDVFAAELARLEWALVQAVHSPASPVVTSEAIAAASRDGLGKMHFVRNEASVLLEFQFAVNLALQGFLADGKVTRTAASPTYTVVTRQGYRVWRLDLDPNEVAVLTRLWGGLSLGAALDNLDVGPDIVTRWFKTWVEKGFSRRCRRSVKWSADGLRSRARHRARDDDFVYLRKGIDFWMITARSTACWFVLVFAVDAPVVRPGPTRIALSSANDLSPF